MRASKIPLVVGLIVLIVAAVGFVLYQTRGPASLSQSRQEAIKSSQQGVPGTFTPAPR